MAALTGWAGSGLLDPYDAARRPVFCSTARDFIERAITADRAFLAAFDPGRDRAAFERGGPCAEGDYDTIRLVCLALTPRDGFSGLIDTAACRLPARRVP